MGIGEPNSLVEISLVDITENTRDLECGRGVEDVIDRSDKSRREIGHFHFTKACTSTLHVETVLESTPCIFAISVIHEIFMIGRDISIRQELVDCRIGMRI